MVVIRVKEEWQRAGVYTVRTLGMCKDYDIPLSMEFEDDTKESEYILAMDGNIPVSTCRIRLTDPHTGKVERVCTLPEYRGKRYGEAVIREAESWLKDKGADRVFINSREEALRFYERLGYTPDYTKTEGTGMFRCIMTSREL